MPEDSDLAGYGPLLLAWFDRHRRDLPWRGILDPYRILVSEIMLQQTRVDVVLPFYERFVKRFPSIEELARAELSEVLALWSGLGYYRRGRMLHAAAREIAGSGGEIPRSVEGLRGLPGVGEYTSAAVASIAFGVAVPVLDGNVERVLTRLLALSGRPKAAPLRRRLLEEARVLLVPGRPGDSNQALMELGATLCTPRRPLCLLCPLRQACGAAAAGNPESYPTRGPQRPVERRCLVVAVVESRGRVLLHRRSDRSSLLAGTWELPWVEEIDAGTAPGALAAKYGGRWRIGEQVAKVRHGITFRDLRVAVHRAEVAGDGEVREDGTEAAWYDAAALAGLPHSSLVRKVLAALARSGKARNRGKAGAPPRPRARG